MKNISENSINFDLKDMVFLSFQDKINIENDYKASLKELKKNDLKTIIRYMALFANCDELVVLYNEFNKYTKNDIYDYIINNQGFIIESFIKNLAIDSFNSLKVIIELLDKNGYYRFNYKEFFHLIK